MHWRRLSAAVLLTGKQPRIFGPPCRDVPLINEFYEKMTFATEVMQRARKVAPLTTALRRLLWTNVPRMTQGKPASVVCRCILAILQVLGTNAAERIDLI